MPLARMFAFSMYKCSHFSGAKESNCGAPAVPGDEIHCGKCSYDYTMLNAIILANNAIGHYVKIRGIAKLFVGLLRVGNRTKCRKRPLRL